MASYCRLRLVLLIICALIGFTCGGIIRSRQLPHEPPILHRLKPILDPRDHDNQPCSQSTTVLKRRNLQYSYHNYTPALGHDDTSRWTAREVSTTPLTIQPRGYISNGWTFDVISWKYSNPLRWSPEGWGYHVIKLCFADEESRNNLTAIMCVATERWKNKLVERTSLYLELRHEICPRDPVTGGTRMDRVAIVKDPGKFGVATLGWQASFNKTFPQHPKIDPVLYDINLITPQPDMQSAVGAVVHELGHVLGLGHEQEVCWCLVASCLILLIEEQRPDAWDYIQYSPWEIDGHDELKQYLEDVWVPWPDSNVIGKSGRITIWDMYQHGELSYLQHMSDLWGGKQYIPTSSNQYGLNALGLPSMLVMPGPFDPDSAMLYPSSSIDPNKPIILFHNGQHTWRIRKSYIKIHVLSFVESC